MKTKNLLVCLLGSVFLSNVNTEAENQASPLAERLPAKIQKIQSELPVWMQKAENKDKAMALMQKLKEQMDAKNFEEAEKAADLILAMMGGSVPAAAPTSNPAAVPTSNSTGGRAQSMLVLVTVRENNGSTKLAAGSSSGGTTTPYSHTNNKSLSISLVNTTKENLKVNVKVTFLAQDQAGNHDIVDEKTMESERTIVVGKADLFTTDEVSFTHASAHRGAQSAGGGDQGGGGAQKAGGAQGGGGAQSLIPASGHIYAGYKVEVFRGSEVVGAASSNPGK